MAVFNGVLGVANETSIGVELCSIIACTGDTIEECSSEFPAGVKVQKPLRIESLIITRASADIGERSFFEPSTLSIDGLPLNGSDFIYVTSGHRNSTMMLLTLTRPRNDLATFGIFGRRFDRDGQPTTSAANTFVPFTYSLKVLLTLLTFFYYKKY